MPTEAERLQKIVDSQGKELGRLRKLLSQARVCQVDYFVEGTTLRIIATCIGVDEYHFLEKLQPALESVANAIIGARNVAKLDANKLTDADTSEPLEGAVGHAD